MTTTISGVPGVYVRERLARQARALPTGVPVFVGFVTATPDNGGVSGPTKLHHKTELSGNAVAYLGAAVNGFFDNGGGYCYIVAVKTVLAKPVFFGGAEALQLMKALELTAHLDDVDLVAIPDAHIFADESLILQVQRAVIDHCTANGRRIAVLEALRGKSAPALIDAQIRKLGIPATGPANVALYHPWIRPIANGGQFVPPSGQVAGIIARTDAEAGVFKAPANAEVQDATDVEIDLDPDSLAILNANGVNCIRAFPSRGIRVFGARTLSPDGEWTYLNVRRLVLTVLRWVDANMTWAAFEPNVPALWARIERELGTYLNALWRSGALKGDTPTEAFFVRCDVELNPAATREIGQVVTEIGLAPTAPAEFVIVTVQHRAGTTELT